MKLLIRYVLFPVSAILLSSASIAVQSKYDSSEYALVALKHCEVVSESALTEEQLNAYLALKEEETLMHGLEAPIEGLNEQIQELTNRIEEVTSLAVQETDNSIYIDKQYLKEQEGIADELNALMSAHKVDFDALEVQGRRIGKKAKIFERAIEAGLEDLDYDQLRIISPESDDDHYRCNNSAFTTKL